MPRGDNKRVKSGTGQGGLGKYMPGGASGEGYHDIKDKADWSAVHPDYLAAAVVAADRAGGALLFGADRKASMFAITIFFDGQKNTLYWVRTMEGAAAVEEWLAGFVSDLNNPDGATGGR